MVVANALVAVPHLLHVDADLAWTPGLSLIAGASLLVGWLVLRTPPR